MRSRKFAIIGSVGLVVGIFGTMSLFAPAQASRNLQTATSTATVAVTDTATATSTTAATAAATGTATAVVTGTATAAVTDTATVGAATAVATGTATATPIPVAAFPAPFSGASVTHTGHSLTFRWSLINQRGVKGFNLYAGKHKLNRHLIPTHRSLLYSSHVAYHKGRPVISAMFRNGTRSTVAIP